MPNSIKEETWPYNHINNVLMAVVVLLLLLLVVLLVVTMLRQIQPMSTEVR